MESFELKEKIKAILDDKQGGDILDVALEGKTSIADYFVIATGKNLVHTRALAEAVEEKLEAEGIFAKRKDGLTEMRWVVLDYGDVIVHLFQGATRDFYALEKLWK